MMTIVVASGILLSRAALPATGIAVNGSRYWRELHHVTSNLVIFLVGLHLALSWGWITSAWTRYLPMPAIRRRRHPDLAFKCLAKGCFRRIAKRLGNRCHADILLEQLRRPQHAPAGEVGQ